MVTDPVRLDEPVLADAVTDTVPVPVPDPLLTESHAAPDVAVHAQLAPAVTATLTLPPPATIDALPGLIA
jgi:hypothetical protein